jgi:hypothetical protein
VKVGVMVYTLRNELGIPLSPQARGHAIEMGQNGGTL